MHPVLCVAFQSCHVMNFKLYELSTFNFLLYNSSCFSVSVFRIYAQQKMRHMNRIQHMGEAAFFETILREMNLVMYAFEPRRAIPSRPVTNIVSAIAAVKGRMLEDIPSLNLRKRRLHASADMIGGLQAGIETLHSLSGRAVKTNRKTPRHTNRME
jgi:hypothetical protein